MLRYMAPDIQAAHKLIFSGAIMNEIAADLALNLRKIN